MMASAGNVNFAAFATNLYERYTGLSLRERVLVTLAVLAVTWMAWSATLGGFLESSKAQLERDIDSVYSRMQAAVAEQTALESAKANDPNLRLDRERHTSGGGSVVDRDGAAQLALRTRGKFDEGLSSCR